MSTVLSTMANALIDFILSLLRDPEVAAEFDADPQQALDARGLGNASYQDVCAVMPIVYDDPAVVHRAAPQAAAVDPVTPRVIRELQQVADNHTYITNNSTLVDQSVNQNIWAGGDVMQLFDNEAIVASGEGSAAAGGHIIHDSSTDSSTTITAGNDAYVDSDVDVSQVTDSYNDDSSTTDNSMTDASTTLAAVTVTAGDTTDAAADAAPADAPEAPAPVEEPEPLTTTDALLPEPDPIEESFDDDGY